MKSSTALHQNLNSVQTNTIFPDTHFIDAEFHSDKQHASQLVDLYQKHEDEPDFDCEFLQGISYDYNEDRIDLESEVEEIDDYNDNQWDADVYDPYLESTYY